MGPLGLYFMALWTLCELTGAQRLQSERKNGLVLKDLGIVCRFCLTPRDGGSKMSALSLGRYKLQELHYIT